MSALTIQREGPSVAAGQPAGAGGASDAVQGDAAVLHEQFWRVLFAGRVRVGACPRVQMWLVCNT